MKLTGKCKTIFLEYYKQKYSYLGNSKYNSQDDFDIYLKCNNILITTLIIEFFDSVGIFENIFYYEYRKTKFQDYKEAINKSIIKANEIYNSK